MKKNNSNKEKLEELEREIRALSKEDRGELLIRLGLPESHRPYGTINGYDIDELVREGTINDLIRIDDMLGEYQQNPRITIKTVERRLGLTNNSDYESIDIFASIRANPDTIGHPLILFVIQRWIAIARYYSSLSKQKPAWIERYKVAEEHLRRVGAILLEIAEKSGIPYEYARLYLYKRGIKESPKYGVLSAAWNLLAQDDIKSIRREDLKLKRIKQELNKVEGFLEYSIDEVIGFLESNSRYISRRRSWVATQKAYDAWHLSLNQATLRRYKTKANKQSLRLQDVGPGPPESALVTVSDIANTLGDWLSLPTLTEDGEKQIPSH